MAIQNICDTNMCTGCETCLQICTHSAITMQSNEEGFLYPRINPTLCIECGLCKSRCPVNFPITRKFLPLEVYSGWSNNENIRIESSSGGAFTEIAKLILRKKGVVFGVAMDKDINARHIYVEKETDLEKLRGSKYVQSTIADSYIKAKEFLSQGREVLFSGTPCQIAGLRNFLHKDFQNLTTVDIICHGVPSPKVFNDYKIYIESLINEKIENIKFRCKKSSWIFYNMGINSHIEKNGKTTYTYIGNYYSDPYIRAFLRDNILRQNCYNCQYTSTQRVSDFTIADWWKYKATKAKDKDYDKKGVSLLMCNTEKAVSISKHLNMELTARTLEEALKTNISLKHPFPMPITRKQFWKDYRNLSFDEMKAKWMYPDKIPLSIYLKIYHRKLSFLFQAVNLYEKVVRKIHLQNFIIKIQAK